MPTDTSLFTGGPKEPNAAAVAAADRANIPLNERISAADLDVLDKAVQARVPFNPLTGTFDKDYLPDADDAYKVQLAQELLAIPQVLDLFKQALGLTSSLPAGATPRPIDWISDGDSLVFGQLTSDPATKNWPTQLYAQLDHSKFAAPLVIAVSGQSTADMLGRQAQYLFGNIAADVKHLIVTVGGGVNPLMAGVPLATVRAQHMQYIQQLRAWMAANRPTASLTVMLEALTRNGKQYGTIALDQYEILRQQRNNEAFTDYKTTYGADYYANYDSAPELVDVDNTTYYVDKQHFTDAGQLVRALVNKPLFLAASVGLALAPTPNYVPSTTPEPALSLAAGNLRVFLPDNATRDANRAVSAWDCAVSADVLTATGAVTYFAEGGPANKPFVRLSGGAKLLGSLLLGISGSQPESGLVVVRQAGGGNQNILGHGGSGDVTGSTRDVAYYNDNVILHINGGTFSQLPVGDASAWHLVSWLVCPPVDGDVTGHIALDNSDLAGSAHAYPKPVAVDSVLSVGLGGYAQLNGTQTLDIALVVLNGTGVETDYQANVNGWLAYANS